MQYLLNSSDQKLKSLFLISNHWIKEVKKVKKSKVKKFEKVEMMWEGLHGAIAIAPDLNPYNLV